jgi:hypothetical protein
MQLSPYEELGNLQKQIYDALWSNVRYNKVSTLCYALSYVPNMQEEVLRKWREWEYKHNMKTVECNVVLMEEPDLDQNLRFCSEIISERMRIDFHSPISPNAIQMLFFFPEPLQQETVLYIEKEKDGNEVKLKLSDFLNVLKYAKKFAEANLDADFDKYNGGLLAIQTVELAINHKPVDKPLNKALHLANDVLTEFAKALSKDKETKRTASGISLLVDLAIDFLVRG